MLGLRAVAAATREALGAPFVEAVERNGTKTALTAIGPQIGRLQELVDAVRLDDFGGAVFEGGADESSDSGSDSAAAGAGPGWPVVKYQHVEQGVGYSMGVFVLPPSGFIPLHSHQEMCVISKLLYGDLR